MRRMHVALVSPFDPFPGDGPDAGAHLGGVERVLGEVAAGLARRGHEVTLVCSTQGATKAAEEAGRHVRRRHRAVTLLRAPMARLSDALPEDADVVHVPATYPFTTVPVLRAAHAEGIPSVLDFHFEPKPTGALVRLGAFAYGVLASRAYRLARIVLIRSRAYARTAASLAFVPKDRLRIVPNGFDPLRFNPGPAPSEGEGILFVGRLVPYKGLDVLLHALARLSNAPPLRVAGDGPERGKLELLAAKLRVDVTFLGRVQDEALPGLYRAAGLTVLPSVNGQEAFGITLLESLACGTPVVASALPGVAEVARHGGLTAPPGNAGALARAIEAALRPGALPRGPALASRVHAAYTWDSVLDRVEAAYGAATRARKERPSPRSSRDARHRRHAVL